MYRKYPNKEGKTFKYHGYTKRLFDRLEITSRYELRNLKKGLARSLVHQLGRNPDDEDLEIRLFECDSNKQTFGYLD